MENASKALIIAGAILLSILIISLGLMIFNQAKEVVSGSSGSMTEVEISTFNSKFEAYAGDKISGSNVNALLNAVISSNVANAAAGESEKVITVDVGSSGIAVGSITTTSTPAITYTGSISKKAQTGSSYTVSLAYGANGLVNKVTLAKN